MSENANGTEDGGFLLDLTFGPAWARRSPSPGASHAHRDSAEQEAPDPRRRREPQGRFRDSDRRERTPRRERQRGPDPRHADFPSPRREFEPRAPLRVSLIPEPRQLSALIRQIRAAKKAYPLPNLAMLLLSKPEYCCAKIESLTGEQRVALHECRQCKAVAFDRNALTSHALRAHLDDFFAREEKEIDPPSGQFVCVARCGLSGVLLGPPNHHSFAEKLQEVHAQRFADMPLDEYRKRVEMRREPELIEQWRNEARKQTLYRLKTTESPESSQEPQTRAAAEAHFLRQVLPTIATTTVRSVIPLTTALNLEDRQIRQAVRETWQRETRAPRSLLFALRAALRHKRLHLFKAGKAWEYVSAVAPCELDATHVIAPIREILAHLRKHPGSKRENLLAELQKGAAPDAPQSMELLSHVAWLAEKGHIIEIHDGSLVEAGMVVSLPEERNAAPRPQTPESAPAAAATPDSGA